jgi:pimeloyl-ACP methyl ester carboxylesterase
MAAAKTQSLFSSLNLTHNISKTSSGSEVHSYTSDLGSDKPILTLIHGYPQSAFEWRYVVPLLHGKVSLFVPELPGYGISSPIVGDATANTKRAVGGALIEALADVFKTTSSSQPRKLILGGHDRGARLCHRLSVDASNPPSSPGLFKSLHLDVIGTILLDIIPTREQWRAFSDPVIAAGYFHWPLLANTERATEMITAYGGDKWARDAHIRIVGPNPTALERIQKDGAVDIYAELFSKQDTIYYTCLDYEAGAKMECDEQEEDQAAGRKVGTPLLVMFSKARLGARTDVEQKWRDWVGQGVEYEGVGVGEGYGHYLPEEAHDIVVPKIEEYLKKRGI